jgi:dimethylamine/trimethylamine dehydrogenase
MECAMVLGKRQMRRVHLVDAARELAGCMRWIPRLPGLGEWARVVNYRQIQLAKLKNVQFIPGTRLEADAVLDYGAEIVIIATGSQWAGDGRSGQHMQAVPGADAELSHVVTPEQLMVDGKACGSRVVVFDAEGYFMGHEVATKLVREGHHVTLVTPHEVVAPYCRYTLELPRVNRGLREEGVTVHTGHVLVALDEESATVRDVWTDQQVNLAADTVVLVTQRYSDDALFHELASRPEDVADAGISGLYRIGDCVAPNLIAEAIFSSHRLAREIDSENPAVALPFVRERRVLGATDADFVLGNPLFSPNIDDLAPVTGPS